MLQNQQKQSLLKLATTPTLAPAAPKYRVILSDSNKTNKILVNDKIQIAKSKPMAAVVGCKRPAEPEPCLSPSIKSEEDEDDEICGTPMRKRANLDHLSPEERLQRRKLKNRVAAQNARDKKRVKMEDMEAELLRLKNHAKSLENKNAQLVGENQRLVAENDRLRSDCESRIPGAGQESSSPLVAGQTPESAVLTNVPQQQEQVCPRSAGGPLGSTASLIMASKLLLNVLKANTPCQKLPLKKRWPT